MGAALAPAIGGVVGGLGGLFGGKSKYKDAGTYGMTQPQRAGLGTSAYNQLQGQYGTDPNAFWGGKPAWTTSEGMGPEGGITWGHLVGGGGGGGGGARAGHATASLAKVGLGIDDPTYALEMPKTEEERYLQKANEMGSAQAADSWRQMQDQLTRGGTASDSPAALAARSQIERQRLRGSAEGLRDTRMGWSEQARGLRHGWNELATGVNVSNAGNETQVSMGNAANDTQASSVNAGLGESAAGREAAAAQFLMGARGRDEDRMLDRYNSLNSNNLAWQRPTGQMQEQQGAFARLMQGAAGGIAMGSDLSRMSSGGGGGNSEYGPYRGGYKYPSQSQGYWPSPKW